MVNPVFQITDGNLLVIYRYHEAVRANVTEEEDIKGQDRIDAHE